MDSRTNSTHRRFLITIDTEGDNLWASPREVTTRNAVFLPRFQALCEAHGLKPTYLTDYHMARCPAFQEFGRDLQRRQVGEIGMHLHAWDTPPLEPLTADDLTHQPYLMEYPAHLMRAKVVAMTELLEATFGRKMVSHRAGRWGFNERYARILVENGYRVDCSVTPHKSWTGQMGAPTGAGGSDYNGFPDRAYFMDLNNIAQPGASLLLEVPLTVMRPWQRLAQSLHRWTAPGPRALRAMVNRLYPPILQLRPSGANRAAMLAIVARARHEDRGYLEFMLHSSELMPGGSPTFPAERHIESLYDDLHELFAAARKAAFTGATMEEYRQEFQSERSL
jgi:hypothetical protein